MPWTVILKVLELAGTLLPKFLRKPEAIPAEELPDPTAANLGVHAGVAAERSSKATERSSKATEQSSKATEQSSKVKEQSSQREGFTQDGLYSTEPTPKTTGWTSP